MTTTMKDSASETSKPEWVTEMIQQEKLLRNEIVVTLQEYAEAVLYLANMATQDTSGSRAAAQVILSLYNGFNWHMDLTDFYFLDYKALKYAFLAIRGRLTLHEEPHNVIENGRSLFRQLEEQWQHLHTSNRYL